MFLLLWLCHLKSEALCRASLGSVQCFWRSWMLFLLHPWQEGDADPVLAGGALCKKENTAREVWKDRGLAGGWRRGYKLNFLSGGRCACGKPHTLVRGEIVQSSPAAQSFLFAWQVGRWNIAALLCLVSPAPDRGKMLLGADGSWAPEGVAARLTQRGYLRGAAVMAFPNVAGIVTGCIVGPV